jgi:hypothetical protein
MRSALLVVLVCCSTAFGQTRYTDRMFRRALDEAGSTSPLYLLFTLNDPVAPSRHVVATPANGLLGAIHFEYHLNFDSAGVAQAARIAASQQRHEFTFQNRKALYTVRPYYSEAILAEVRRRLARRSNAQLIRDGMLYTSTRITHSARFTTNARGTNTTHIAMRQRTHCLRGVFSLVRTIARGCCTPRSET